jgi:hypothetical protein
MQRRRQKRRVLRGSPATWLVDSERLYEDFKELTPYLYRPFVRSFSSFSEYERWKRGQQNPWYR